MDCTVRSINILIDIHNCPRRLIISFLSYWGGGGAIRFIGGLRTQI